MGNALGVKSIANYDNVKEVVVKSEVGILIHIMDKKQTALIHGTISADIEEEAINAALDKNEYDKHIIVYGKNTQDIRSWLKNENNLYLLVLKTFKYILAECLSGHYCKMFMAQKSFQYRAQKAPWTR